MTQLMKIKTLNSVERISNRNTTYVMKSKIRLNFVQKIVKRY